MLSPASFRCVGARMGPVETLSRLALWLSQENVQKGEGGGSPGCSQESDYSHWPQNLGWAGDVKHGGQGTVGRRNRCRWPVLQAAGVEALGGVSCRRGSVGGAEAQTLEGVQ